MIKYVVPLKRLTAITDHPALDANLVCLLLLYTDCHEFGDFGAQGMLHNMLLLQGRYLPNLVAR